MKGKLAVFIGIFFMTPFAYSLGLDDVYVQEKNKLMSFKQAIASQQGFVEQKNDDYYLTIGSYSTSFNLKGNIKAFGEATATIFPKRIFVELFFMDLYPNAQIYFDNTPIGITDHVGNANKFLYLEKTGIYIIQIRKPKDKVANQEVNIEDTCKVECKDVQPMICNVSNKN